MESPVEGRACRRRCRCAGSTASMQCRMSAGSGGSFLDPLEQVTWLAVEHPTHGLQSAEPNSLRATVLQHRDIRRCQPDPLGEFTDAHLASGQLDVDAHHDGHQMIASLSVRSVVACRSSARITTINSPSTETPTTIKNSRSGSPGSSALKPTWRNTPASTTHAATIAHTIAFTHARETSLKMRSFLTRVSSFQVDTITTWMQSTQNTVTAVAGHLRYAYSGSCWAMYANCPGSDMTWNRTNTPNSTTRKTLRRATARCSMIMH